MRKKLDRDAARFCVAAVALFAMIAMSTGLPAQAPCAQTVEKTTFSAPLLRADQITTVSIPLVADHIIGRIALTPARVLLADRDRSGALSAVDILRILLYKSPEILSLPPLTAEEGSLYLYDIEARGDLPDEPLIYDITGGPRDMFMNRASGALAWIPGKEHLGSHDVSLIVRDVFDKTASQTFALEVRDSNDPPRITSPAPEDPATEKTPWTFQSAAQDPDGDTLAWSLMKAPAGMTVDPSSGLLAWTPDYGQAGNHKVFLRVTDGKGGADVRQFTLACISRNGPPVIVSTPPDDALTSTVLIYQAIAVDPNPEDAIGFLLEQGPQGMTIGYRSGLLRWPVPADAAGDHPVTIAAMDSVGNTGRQSFVLKVTEYNFPPAITSVPRLSARIGSVWRYDVTASDPDGDTVSFTLAQGPDGMTVNGANGGMEWTPSPAQAGLHRISVQALDGKGGIGSQSFELSAHVPGPPLEVISVTPDDGTTNVLTSENTITWTFSAPVDPATVEGQFLIYYTDWETTAPIPVTWSLSPDLRSLTATVSKQFQYTPPKMWGSHLPVPCEPGYFPGSYGRTGYPLTMITGRLFEGITDQKGNPLVPFRSGFSMFRRFIWIGSYSHHLILSPDGKRLVSHRSPGTAPGSGVPVNIINADWESPEGHMQIASFGTATASGTPFNSFFSPDSRLFYCCSYTNQSRIYLFDMETLAEPTFIATPDPPHQIIPTKDFKKAYVYFNCKSSQYPLQHVDILDIDPDSPTYHQWIALNVFGDFGYSGTTPRTHFTMLPDGRRMFLCRNTPDTPDPFKHWGVADIDPLSSDFHQFIYAEQIALYDDYTPPYQITPNGKWLFGSPAGSLSCGSCAYFSRKLITEEDPALWVTDKVWTNAIGYAGSDQMGCAPDSRTIYWGTLNRYIMVFDIDRGTWIDADRNPETRQLLTGDHGGFKGDFPEGISLIRNQLWNWWGSQVWGNVAAPCLVPEHNKFFYFAGGSLICEAIPTVPNPWLEPPRIEIIAPTPDAVLGRNSVMVVGTAADNHGPASVTVNGNKALVEGELFSAEIPLSPGENIITARAVDVDGNASEDFVTVLYDPEAPAVMITSPVTASHIRHAPVIVEGEVDDQDIAAVNLNGEDVALLAGAFQKTLPVAEGVNLFHAAARNAAGKTGHGFCVVHYRKNHPPVFTFAPIESAEEGSPYACPATAADPDGDVLEYSLLDAPEGMIMDARTGLIQWTPSGFDIGLNHVAVMTRDGWGEFDIRRFHITVIAKGTDITAPRVRVIPETAAADVNIFFNVVVEAEDETGITSRSLEVNGKGTALTFDPASGNWQAAVRLGTTGENTLRGTALDASGNRGEDTAIVYVYDSADRNPPNLKILAPASGATLKDPADVYCVIGDIHMDWWVLEYALKGDDNFMELTRGTQSFTGVIHTLVPDTILPGAYILRLRARDKNFLTSAVEIEFTKEDYALGYNEYEATDLSIPMMGMNLEVKRRYNSFNKSRGEFGIGWRLEDMNFVLNISEDYDVIIRKPDGSTAFFLLDYETIYPFNPRFVRASYKPFGPTVDKLDFSGEHILFVTDTKTLLTWPDLRDFQPETFTLTTPDGRAFTIQGPGDDSPGRLTSIADLNGNTLEFRDSGMYHSAGPAILFSRDPEGRVTSVTDPLGAAVLYEYDASGNLVKVTSRRGFASTYTYDDAHNMLTSNDPAGVGYIYEYDENGRVIAMVDGEGNRREMEYDTAGRQQISKDPQGNPLILTYDEKGRVIAKTDALNQTTLIEYNDLNLPVRLTDAAGNVTLQAWDAAGNLLSKTDALGNTSTFTYNHLNRQTSATNARGHTTLFGYDEKGNRTSITDPAGGVTSFEYDSRGNLVRETDPLGQETRYEYDTFGRKIVDDPPGPARTEMTYDDNGRMTEKTTFRTSGNAVVSETHSYQYDAEGNLTQTVRPDGAVQENLYDEAGRVTGAADPKGRKSDFSRDGRGLLTQGRHKSGRTFDFEYDRNGNLQKLGSSMGVSVNAELDELGRTKRVNNPDGTFRLYQYNALGKAVSETDSNGNTKLYDYDVNGNVTCTTDTLGNVIRNEYDAVGNLVKMTDPNGNVYEYEYDSRNLNTLIRFPDGTTRKATFDAAGRKSSETDQAGQITRYRHDERGNLLEVTDPLGRSTRYTWDENRNMTSVTDTNDRTTSYTYDSNKRLISTTRPDGKTKTCAYDKAGNLIRETDFNGHTTTHEYDPDFDLLTKTTYFDGSTETRTYDGQNRLETVTNSEGTLTFAYDSMSRISSVTDTFGQTVSYTYDSAGNRKTVQTPFGLTTYNYNAINRLVELMDHSGAVTDFAYDATGNLLEILRPNGVNTAFDYDRLNRLTAITHRKDSDILASFAYALGPAGNRTRVVENTGRTVDYAYDAAYKLTREAIQDPVNGSRVLSYTYDAAGNRLTKHDNGTTTTCTYDEINRLILEKTISAGGIADNAAAGGFTMPPFRFNGFSNCVLTTVIFLGLLAMSFLSTLLMPMNHGNRRRYRLRLVTAAVLLFTAPLFIIGPDSLQAFAVEALSPPLRGATVEEFTGYNWDDNGNLIAINAPAGTTSLQYDPANRLTDVISPAAHVEYSYDGLGNRILRQDDGGEMKRYLLDRNTGPGGIKNAQVLAEMDGANLLQCNMTRAFEDLLHFERAGVTHHPLTDGTLSTRLLTDNAGAVTDTYIYEAFGKLLSRTGNTENDFLFAGQQFDPNAGFYYMRARYYNPATGGFITPDARPFEIYDPATLHRYTYAFNNPVNYYDPSGEVGTLQEAVISSAIIGGLTSALVRIMTSKQKGWNLVKEVLLAAAVGAAFGAIGGGLGHVATGMATNIAFSWPAWKLSGRAIIGIGYASFIIVPLAYADIRIWGGGTSEYVAVTLVLAWIIGFICFMAGAAADLKMENMIIDESIEVSRKLPIWVMRASGFTADDIEKFAVDILMTIGLKFKILSSLGIYMSVFSPFVQSVISWALGV